MDDLTARVDDLSRRVAALEARLNGIRDMASQGGKARAAKMTPRERSECARRAAETRWGRKVERAGRYAVDTDSQEGGLD